MRRVGRLSGVLLAMVLAGCGSGTAGTAKTGNATLVLDFAPNAIHAGIYSALARGYDHRAGVRLHIIVPSAATDSIKLLETGRANFAILDIHDLAIARERGEDLVGIMAIVERPLAAVIAAPSIAGPRRLQGRTVGVTGLPSDTAVLRSIVSGDGGNPKRVKTVTIGFNAVASLLSGRVAAATAFWNDEGVTLAHRRPGSHVFRVDDYGAPSYPELVLTAMRSSLHAHPELARSVVRALVRGYGVTLSDPHASAAELEAQVPGLDPVLVAAELKALEPALAGSAGSYGRLDLRALRAWGRWEARFGIVKRPPDVGTMFDPGLLPGGASASK